MKEGGKKSLICPAFESDNCGSCHSKHYIVITNVAQQQKLYLEQDKFISV